MTQDLPLDSQISELMKKIQMLEVTCLKLEAERDAHMQVIKNLFLSMLEGPGAECLTDLISPHQAPMI